MKILDRLSEKEYKNKSEIFALFNNCPIPEDEVLSNLGLFINSRNLKRILFLNDLYKKIIPVNGVVFDFGTRYGQNLSLFSSFRDIYEPYNNFRKIIGFDTFQGFPSVDKTNDGNECYVTKGNYTVPENYDTFLTSVLNYHNEQTPTPHIKKYELIKGNASKTIHEYLEKYPATIIAMAYFDFDLYEPTKECLKSIQPHLTKGSILAFDELNNEYFPGETLALKEIFGLDKQRIVRSPYSGAVSYIQLQ